MSFQWLRSSWLDLGVNEPDVRNGSVLSSKGFGISVGLRGTGTVEVGLGLGREIQNGGRQMWKGENKIIAV